MVQDCRVKCFKYLGLMVDHKLKWVDHIAHVKLKSRSRIRYYQQSSLFFIQKLPQEFILFFYVPIFHLLCGNLG